MNPILTGSTTTTCSTSFPTANFSGAASATAFGICTCIRLDGKQRKRLTEGNWEVTALAGVDEAKQRVYFVSTEASPLERQLYSVKLNGKDSHAHQPGRGHPPHLHGSGTANTTWTRSPALTEPPRTTLHPEQWRGMGPFREADHKLTDEYEILPTEIVTAQSAGWNAALRAA